MLLRKLKSSRLVAFCRVAVLKNLLNFVEKHIQWRTCSRETLLTKKLHHKCFLWLLWNFSQQFPYRTTVSGYLLRCLKYRYSGYSGFWFKNSKCNCWALNDFNISHTLWRRNCHNIYRNFHEKFIFVKPNQFFFHEEQNF